MTATQPEGLDMTDEQILEITREYQTVVPGNCLYILEFARALLAAVPAQPVEQTLPIMRKAFRVTETEGDTDPSKQRFHMRFTFRSMEELHAADEQWRAFASTSANLTPAAPAQSAEPVAWFIADDNGEVYRATGYEHERDQWRAVGHEVHPLYAAPQQASDAASDLAFSVYSGLNALRWLLNLTTEFDRKDVRTRQAARLLDEYTDSFGKTNRERLEDMWKTLHDKLPDDGRISEYLRAHDAAGRELKAKGPNND
jgi:hypothetical protein